MTDIVDIVKELRAEKRPGDGQWFVEGREALRPLRRRAANEISRLRRELAQAERERDEAREQRKQCATEIVDDLILPALPKWQPIETAPKEHGEYVLLWIPGKNRRAIGWWDRDRYSKRPRPFWIWTIGSRHSISDCRANPPTHWQHLPMPPEAK